MPAGPVTIDTGDALPATFTYTVNVPGTPPYTYDISFTGLAQSGIVPIISGVDGEIVNLDATNAVGGEYEIGIRCKITDANGDIDEDIDYYYITVNGIVASWDVAPTWAVGNLEQDATSGSSATLTVASGGAAPYNYSFAWQGGSPPAAGMSIVQGGGPTDNIIEISTAGTTPPGSYSGTIIGSITDATGQVLNVNLDVTFIVLGMRGWTWSPSSLTELVTIPGDPAVVTASVVDGVGGIAPYSYLMFWADQPDSFSIVVSGASNETVAVQTLVSTINGSYPGTIRARVIDSVGNQIEVDLPISITVDDSVPVPSFDDAIALLSPVIEYRYDEAAGALLNYGSGSTFDVPLVSEVAARLVTNGDVRVPGICMTWDGSPNTEGFRKTSAYEDIESLTEGSIIIVFRTSDTGGTKVIQDGQGDFFFQPRAIITAGVTGNFQYTMSGGSGGWTVSKVGSVGPGTNDGNWHVAVITNPIDGGGPDLFYDGVTIGVSVPVNTQPDYWFATGDAFTEWTVGHSEANSNPWIGEIDRYLIVPSILTEADALELFELYTTVP